jgi:3-methyladenine DNA glycosylase AlkD
MPWWIAISFRPLCAGNDSPPIEKQTVVWMKINSIRNELKAMSDPSYAAVSQRFFKTGPGDYGEGDIFIGVRVPVLRRLAKKYTPLPSQLSVALLKSPVHEERHLALFLLMYLYQTGQERLKAEIYQLYLAHTAYINNWDLVDTSAEQIVGHYLLGKDKGPLHRLALSASLWERRIAIVATFCYIKKKQFEDTLKIAQMLLQDEHDLIHKAVGWMLREVGKRDQEVEIAFLNAHFRKMPRTMLRYAIEKFPEPLRQAYLKGTFYPDVVRTV